jgi:hypothetical protein
MLVLYPLTPLFVKIVSALQDQRVVSAACGAFHSMVYFSFPGLKIDFKSNDSQVVTNTGRV